MTITVVFSRGYGKLPSLPHFDGRRVYASKLLLDHQDSYVGRAYARNPGSLAQAWRLDAIENTHHSTKNTKLDRIAPMAEKRGLVQVYTGQLRPKRSGKK